MKTKQDLIDFLYNTNGRARVSRFAKTCIENNNLLEQYELAINSCNNIGLSELTESEKLRAYCKDKMYVPYCKTCKTRYIKWSNKHQDWSQFCSQKCVQNDPTVKENIIKTQQQSVDWNNVINNRKSTMLERYGVTSYQHTNLSKQNLSEKAKERFSDPETKQTILEKRKDTNLERYGVENNLDLNRMEIGRKISETAKAKNKDQKQAITQKFRESRLTNNSINFLDSKEQMEDLYIKKNMSIIGIAKLIGCSEGAVSNSLNKHNIEKRLNQISISQQEIELYEFIKSIYPTAIQTYKIKKHLDVYIPELKLGFEFNGVYWHSEAKKDKEYHKIKVNHFYDHDIRYIQIWEDDWKYRNTVVKNFIRNLLQQNTTRIGARKTTIKLLSQKEFDVFMDQNHMQGSTICSIRVGLLYENTIVSAMGFKRMDNYLDLVRFSNINVTGAFTKILSYIKKHYSQEYEYILSFADLEIVDKRSNVYTKHNFIESHILEPDYKYYNYRTGLREHKFKYRKKFFLSCGYDIENKTERELALEHVLLRCYDSGKIGYVLPLERKI